MRNNHETRRCLADVIENNDSHLVIIGGPGAGKTTVTKYLTLNGFAKQKLLGSKDYSFPLLIRLRELNNGRNKSTFLSSLLSYIGIDVELFLKVKIHKESGGIVETKVRNKDIEKYSIVVRQLAVEVLDALNAVIILDGLDEITDSSLRSTVVQDVRSLCLALKHSKLILTTRTGEYNSIIDNAETFELSPLSSDQISEFILKWLEDPDKSDDLYKQIIKSPFHDTAIRPINLALLCALYLRYNEIPKQPRTVYDKVIHLLIEDWDLQRDIKRISEFGNFPANRKREFLMALAFVLTYQFKTSIFSKAMLNSAYQDICSNFLLPQDEGLKVIKEIESHTGLFINSGHDKYEFPHKSLQEFFAGEYLLKSPHLLNISDRTLHMANEFAIAISLSSDPSASLYHLLDNLPSSHQSKDFLRVFINRMIIERPDFSSSPYLAGGLLKLNTYLGTNEGDEQLMNRLLSIHPNIEYSFRNLQPYYSKYGSSTMVRTDEEIQPGICYQVKEIQKFGFGHSPSFSVVTVNTQMLKWYLEGRVISNS